MERSFAKLHASYAQLLHGLESDALEAHPGKDLSRWNARQVVEHLILSYKLSATAFDERLAKGRPTQYQPSAQQRLMQFFVCQFGYFPSGRPAPAAVTPLEGRGIVGGDELSAQMHAALEALEEQLILCSERFGSQKFATHHVIGPISADQWRRFHVVHGRHHLKQLRALLRKHD